MYNHANQMTVIEEFVASLNESGRYRCPACSQERRKKRERTLSVTVESDRTLFDCWHCNETGVVFHEKPRDFVSQLQRKKREKVSKLPTKLNKSSDLIREFFHLRGVTLEDISNLPVITGTKYFGAIGVEAEAIGFVYGDPAQPNAVKWRPLDGTKAFTQDGTSDIFYGLDMLPEKPKELIIVEGEADVIALASIGIPALSCPNGAPKKVSEGKIDPSEDRKFGYVWESKDLIEAAEKIIIATDNDGPGDALAEELARRIGRAKCYRTDWKAFKDANDMLAEVGAAEVRDALDTSEAMPLSGVYSASEYFGQLEELYEQGHGKGETTGLSNIDELFTVKPGLLYVVTGLPSMGKSEFIDQLMVNLATKRQWTWAVASFENQPAVHMTKLAEKLCGKPFFEGVTPRMSREDLKRAADLIDDYFLFLQSRDGNLPTIDSVLSRTRDAIMRSGCRGLVIDPYNYVSQDSDKSEHKQIEEMLTKLIAFAQAYEIAIFFVAHPKKIYPNEDGSMPVPTGMHISGSAAWFAKADVGFTVHRSTAGVEIHCWKVRHKWIGKQGVDFLDYDVPTGRYFVPKDLERRQAEGPGLSKRKYRKHKTEAERARDFDEINLDDLEF
jgi:twinkle protein